MIFQLKRFVMKKYWLALLLTCSLHARTFSQGITVTAGSDIFMGAGAVVSLDSLVLLPTSPFNITGTRNESRTATVAHPISKPYIKRVYHFSATTTPFTGGISIYYRDAELNGISESALTLNIHNGTAWNAYPAGVTRNGVSNYVTTTGLSSVPLNELTLADNVAMLLVNKAAEERPVTAAIAVYPNPVHDVAVVQLTTPVPGPVRLQLYDEKGALVTTQQETLAKGRNDVRLNMTSYAKGSYTLLAQWDSIAKRIVLIKQ